MAQEAFDLAERLQTPVFVLSDLDLGMNNWMSDPFPYPEKPFDRGKVLDAEGVERLKETWGRYKDLDGDGIPWRTLPGTPHPRAAYFTRGSGHTENAAYSEKPHHYVANVDRLARKEETARGLVPKPVLEERAGSRAGLLAFGTSHYGTTEGRDRLEREHGLPLDYLRLRALPLAPGAREWMARQDVVYVVEQNRDAQLATLLRDEAPELASRLVSVLQYDGLPLDATTVVEGVLSHRARLAGGAR
jgi:2-oxoglutarate ferredoxin oxidoreductase subunit alpha